MEASLKLSTLIPGTAGKKGHLTENSPDDITGLLAAWNNGDEAALSQLMSRVYPEVRRIARQHLVRRPASHTLESAVLANEVFLKLTRSGAIRCEGRVHFLALCSQIIRRLLVDYARSRGYAKRGGNAVRVPLDDVLSAAQVCGIEMVALDEALESLSKIDSRKGRVVELRYFGGLSVEETASILGISPETAKRDWKMAKTWLFNELSRKKIPLRKS